MAVSRSRPAPPRAPKKNRSAKIHGVELLDEYHWLRDKDDPDTLRYLKAENDYTAAALKHTEELQEKLYREMRGRIQETDMSAPVRKDDRFYYHRTVQGLQYAIHCRKTGSLEAEEEILLDENELAQGEEYFRLGVVKVSPDHRLLAYSTDFEGSEEYTIRVKNLETGEVLADSIPNTCDSLEWANDNRTFFYLELDSAHRPFRMRRHVVGERPGSDETIFTEADEGFFLWVSKTRSRAWVLLTSSSKTSSEVHFLDADRPLGKLRTIQPRVENLEYSVDHRGELFYIVTNDGAENFRLMTSPVENPGRSNWREMIPHRPEVRLEDAAMFARHMAILERREGIRRIRVQNLDTGEGREVEFDEPVYTALPGPNPMFETSLLRIHYSSLVTPLSVIDYDMDRGTRELKKRTEVLGGFDRDDYVSERVFAVAPDQVQVPISLVYRKDAAPALPGKGGRPLLLYGYGSYGFSLDPTFSSNRLSLLDRGFIFAIAHVRGGEELGRKWYDQGKLLNKKNSFSDFIACAERLVSEGYTSPQRLVISGGSAGGLLIGAAVNLRPDLFRAAVANVPFVDVVNTMLDPTIPLTVTEYEEWGNPNEREFFEAIRAYSPYENVRADDYPAMLVTAGLNDPRVAYWEPAKWVARLRDRKTDDRPLLLKTNLDAGHGGASGRYDRLKEIALEYAFMLDQTALETDTRQLL